MALVTDTAEKNLEVAKPEDVPVTLFLEILKCTLE
jgi:hypothetical protein